mgnify:CR=1 FL=1
MSTFSTNEKNPNFGIYCMSINRWDAIMTKRLFEYCTYVVREEQAERYHAAGIDDMLIIPNGAVNGFMTTFYWIINNTPEDVICIVDDDIKVMCYRNDKRYPIVDSSGEPDVEMATMECERIGQLLSDLGLGLAFDNPNYASYVYDREFGFKGMPGHIRWVNKANFKARLNDEDPASSDVDMAIQELLLNRIILLPKYYCTTGLMDTNPGTTKSRKKHINLTIAMHNKWGRYYEYDYRKNVARINIKR